MSGGGAAGEKMEEEALPALARKYGALAALRARRDAAGEAAGADAAAEANAAAPPATREELRVLAAEFPGCLRELDTLGAGEIARRARACEAAARGEPGAVEPWMAWIAGYHALMRKALRIRAGGADAAAGGGGGSDQETGGASASAESDSAFAAAVRAPPHGRVGVVVLRALAARFGVPAATIAAALFPVRRPSPYAL